MAAVDSSGTSCFNHLIWVWFLCVRVFGWNTKPDATLHDVKAAPIILFCSCSCTHSNLHKPLATAGDGLQTHVPWAMICQSALRMPDATRFSPMSFKPVYVLLC